MSANKPLLSTEKLKLSLLFILCLLHFNTVAQTTIDNFNFYWAPNIPHINDSFCADALKSPASSVSDADSITREICLFEKQLKHLPRDTGMVSTTHFVKLFETSDITRVEFDNRVSHKFIANNDSTNYVANDSSALFVHYESFGNNVVKKTSTFLYIGNCTITTYVTEYYKRRE
ncbi:MAG: hypothetical protein GC181_07670 [Bacteroidetes bacterium]|nr:hypothetical protein [Bacteroidota bacterium]